MRSEIVCILVILVVLLCVVCLMKMTRHYKESYLNLSNLAYMEADNRLQLQYYDQLYGYDPERWARNEQTYNLGCTE